MGTEREIWALGYAQSVFDPFNSTRVWSLPDYRQVELPNNAIILHQIAESPFYVGKIDDILSYVVKHGAEIERV